MAVSLSERRNTRKREIPKYPSKDSENAAGTTFKSFKFSNHSNVGFLEERLIGDGLETAPTRHPPSNFSGLGPGGLLRGA